MLCLTGFEYSSIIRGRFNLVYCREFPASLTVTFSHYSITLLSFSLNIFTYFDVASKESDWYTANCQSFVPKFGKEGRNFLPNYSRSLYSVCLEDGSDCLPIRWVDYLPNDLGNRPIVILTPSCFLWNEVFLTSMIMQYPSRYFCNN